MFVSGWKHQVIAHVKFSWYLLCLSCNANSSTKASRVSAAVLIYCSQREDEWLLRETYTLTLRSKVMVLANFYMMFKATSSLTHLANSASLPILSISMACLIASQRTWSSACGVSRRRSLFKSDVNTVFSYARSGAPAPSVPSALAVAACVSTI